MTTADGVRLAKRGPLRRLLRFAALGAVLVACALGVPRPAAATSGRAVLADCSGEVVSNRAPQQYFATPTGLVVPADGRLNGLGFSLRVTGYAVRPCLASGVSGTQGLMAGPGESVAVVAYQLSTFPGWDTTEVTHLAFVVNGRQVPVLGLDNWAGWNHLALAVPRSARVGFAVVDAGSTQELSLQTGKRVSPSPLVLYRSWKAPDVTETIDKTVTVEDVDPAQHFSQPDELELLSADLGWFSPVEPLVHAGMRSAFLQVNVAERAPPKYFEVGWSEQMPPGRMRLVLPGGKTLVPDAASADDAESNGFLLGGTYFFDVPWDFTRGTLEVAPGTIPATSDSSGQAMEVTVEGTARFPVSLPPSRAYPARHGTAQTGGHVTHHRHHRVRTAPVHRPVGEFSGALAVTVVTITSTLVVVVPLVFLVPVFIRRRQLRAGPYAYDAVGAPIVPARTPDAGEASASAEHLVADGRAGNGEPPVRPAPYVEVMGEVRFSSLELPTKRLVALEVLCFLACHKPRQFTPEEVRTTLWPLRDDGSEPVSKGAFSSYVTLARRAVGAANFPRLSGGTYGVGPALDTDWERFCLLVERAKAVDGDERRRLLGDALELVRGPIFSGVPNGRYEWALSGGLVSTMTVGIVEAASLLADACAADDVPAEALAGLGRVLVATRDLVVADELLAAADATGNPAMLDRAWEDVLGALGKDASALQRSYDAKRDRLRDLDPAED